MTSTINTDWLLYAFYGYASIFILAFLLCMFFSLVSGEGTAVKDSLFAALSWPRYVFALIFHL